MFIWPERPVEFLFRASRRGDVDGQEELLEVDESVVVGVEGPEDVIAELVRVSGGKALAVDVHESLRGQATVGAVAHEPTIPFLRQKHKIK